MVIWTIAAGTTAALFWAFSVVLTKQSWRLERCPVSGKMIVSSPSGGIVRELFVSDGEMVAKGEAFGG